MSKATSYVTVTETPRNLRTAVPAVIPPPADARTQATTDDERWEQWTARYRETDRRTAAIMKVIAAVTLLAAMTWVVVGLLAR